jgi:hypothetical protein
MPAVQPSCQQVSAVQRCKVLPARTVCAVMAAYLDDLAAGSGSAAEHLVDLEAVLERTRGAGLKLKLAKRVFGKRSVELLGHRVSHGLVRPSDDHTAVLANLRYRGTRLGCCVSLGW